jgi:hypothetical protein
MCTRPPEFTITICGSSTRDQRSLGRRAEEASGTFAAAGRAVFCLPSVDPLFPALDWLLLLLRSSLRASLVGQLPEPTEQYQHPISPDWPLCVSSIWPIGHLLAKSMRHWPTAMKTSNEAGASRLGEQVTSAKARQDEVCCFLGTNRRHRDCDGFMLCR